jgi:ribosome-associated protein
MSEPPPANEDRTSRSELRRASKVREEAIARLGRDLAQLSDKNLERLDVPDTVIEAIQVSRVIKSMRALERQLRVVRNRLRDEDWPSLRARLDRFLLHGAPALDRAPANEGPEREWVVRLVGEGKPALDELLSEHPQADRRHLRQLIKNAEHGSEERRKRAEAKLAQALRSLLGRG